MVANGWNGGSRICVAGSRYHEPSHANVEPKAYHVTDDMALAVDRVIARLIDRAPQAGDFVWLYYGAKWPALRIAREHQIGEAKVRETLKLAVGWVDSALERFRESA